MVNWYNNGFETAKGTIGTGWMTFGKPELNEVLKENNMNIVMYTSKEKNFLHTDEFKNNLKNWVSGWKKTEQWNYEVGKKLPNQLIKNKINDKWVNAQEEWIKGYLDYANRYIRNYLNNTLGVCPICGEFLVDCLRNDVFLTDSFDLDKKEGEVYRNTLLFGDETSDKGIYCDNCNAIISFDEEELPSLIYCKKRKTIDEVKSDTVNFYNSKIKIYKSIIKDFNKIVKKLK